MTSPHKSQAAMLQLIAESMRSPAAERLNPAQLERIAGLLDRIAVDLMLPSNGHEDEPLGGFVQEDERRSNLHS